MAPKAFTDRADVSGRRRMSSQEIKTRTGICIEGTDWLEKLERIASVGPFRIIWQDRARLFIFMIDFRNGHQEPVSG